MFILWCFGQDETLLLDLVQQGRREHEVTKQSLNEQGAGVHEDRRPLEVFVRPECSLRGAWERLEER